MSQISSLKISVNKAEGILKEYYGYSGKASALPGEIDSNFRIKRDDGQNFVLKISEAKTKDNFFEYQENLLEHLTKHATSSTTPKIIPNKQGHFSSKVNIEDDQYYNVRLLTWVSGRLWSQVNPITNALRFGLGQECGKLTLALQGYEHTHAHRNFEWDVATALWTKDYLHLFDNEQRELIIYFLNLFEGQQLSYSKLRKAVVHNDANDNNIIVSEDLLAPQVRAIIDYGDAIHTQIINDVAIACSYAIMDINDPLEAALDIVKGYHQEFPLHETELEHLYTAIAMRLVISVTKSAMNKSVAPENEYLQISEKTAWDLLINWKEISQDYAHYAFRFACGYAAHPNQDIFENWAKSNTLKIEDLFPTTNSKSVKHLDLSVSSSWIGHQSEFNDLDLFQFKIDKLQSENQNKIIAGGYLEPRPLYTSTEYDKVGNNGKESRSIHLGIDFWLPAKTPVHALFDGEVIAAVNDSGDKEYGGLVILKHQNQDFTYFTLYGHLSVDSALKNNIGDVIKKGDQIAVLGNYPENGNWAPHLHFQIMLSMLDYAIDFPGVAYLNQVDIWKSISPDPNLIFNSDPLKPSVKTTNTDLINFRKKHLGKGLSLHYEVPIKMVRGAGQYLMDQFGQKYLDTVNNVAHVGHEHPAVVKAGQNQMALINTNSRYLHDKVNELAAELLDILPPELSVFHFVNSGSEANELALRMAKTVTGEKDMIASEFGYHGNTNACIDISSYKFDGKGGSGAPEHTHIFPLPDAYRGKYRGADSGDQYAQEVSRCLNQIQDKSRNVAGLIVEPILSCGGQIELPKGFLKSAYKLVRKSGGVCISDEVQTGCGRMGKTYWGFQLHDVIPDIITIGKPLGNGHPVAAVVCTEAVAEKFANGMEYFNTFGGNPVSCAIATEVLRVVKRENLQKNALEVGSFLMNRLKELASQFAIIGDVRGEGLFLGIELVDSQLNPLSKQTSYLANRMKANGILMSIDGPDHNVLKIKPPMVFTLDNANELLFYLEKILSEDFMKTY